MSSIMSSRYWTCPSCCTQFDWKDGSAQAHDAVVCRNSYRAEHVVQPSAPVAQTTPRAPFGYKLVAVTGLDELIEALDRADRKGYLPDAIANEWAAFDWQKPDEVVK